VGLILACASSTPVLRHFILATFEFCYDIPLVIPYSDNYISLFVSLVHILLVVQVGRELAGCVERCVSARMVAEEERDYRVMPCKCVGTWTTVCMV